ncbi:MAG: hypothetical protein OXE97_04275, partial [Gammaproteobacteria bacterium]|nr:hypothetical protein [Gammaproteobacteria bacterium]
PVAAQVTGTLTGPAVLPEGGLIAVKYGQCLQPGDRPLFTPHNRYCEWQGGHSIDAMPFARTGRFTLTIRNNGSADGAANIALNRNSGSGNGCDTTVASTGAFTWRSAYLETIGLSNQATFSYNGIPVAANSTRVIRFEMASRRDYDIDGDCVWGFRLNGIQFATLTVEDDEARPYVGPVPGPHPYGAIWRATCLIDGKGVRIISRQCVYE